MGDAGVKERVREYVCVCVRIAERRRSQRQTGVAVWLLQRCLTDDDLQPGMGCGVIASLIESGPRGRETERRQGATGRIVVGSSESDN